MARKEELVRMWERTLDYLFNQRPAFEREGARGYKPGYVSAGKFPQMPVIYLSATLLVRYSSLPPGNGRAALRCRYT